MPSAARLPGRSDRRPYAEPVSTYVAVFALVLSYVALVAAYGALRTLAKLRRATTVLSRGARGAREQESLVEATKKIVAAG